MRLTRAIIFAAALLGLMATAWAANIGHGYLYALSSTATPCMTGLIFDWSDTTDCQAITAVIR